MNPVAPPHSSNSPLATRMRMISGGAAHSLFQHVFQLRNLAQRMEITDRPSPRQLVERLSTAAQGVAMRINSISVHEAVPALV